MNEFLQQFLVEARELIEQADEDLLALEQQPADRERLDSAFRGFHTLKGAAGIVEFPAMGRVLHAAEDMLSAVRTGARAASADLIGDCLDCLDQIGRWLDQVETEGDVPAVPEETVVALVARFSADRAAVAGAELAAASAGAAAGSDGDWTERLLAAHPEALTQARVAVRYAPDADCFFRGEDPLALVTALPGLLELDLAATAPWPDLDRMDPFSCNLAFSALAACSPDAAADALRQAAGQVKILPLAQAEPAQSGSDLMSDARAILEAQLRLLAETAPEGLAGRIGSAGQVGMRVLQALGREAEAQALAAAAERSLAAGGTDALAAVLRAALAEPEPEAAVPPAAAAAPREASARALRVEVERIDALVRLTGELGVLKNALSHAAGLAQAGGDPAALALLLKDQHAALDRLVGELQRSVLGIRVLPLRQVFQRFPRLVREMAASLGKPVRLVVEGETTEADKAVVEVLFEPLMHIVRNALDHGIETPEARQATGKPAVAELRLRAAREGDRVIVEVADDGGGVNTAQVRRIAAERGLASADALAQLSEPEAVALIFTPGFSTAGAVTDLSGRGVGMDAVRAAIERLGGRVEVASRAGQGTSVRLVLPFTVMMSRVMTVEAGGQVFGIPFDAIVETVRVPRDKVSRLGAAEAVILRDRTAPLIRLAEALGLPARDDGAAEIQVVVAAMGGQLGALAVDRFGERLEVMLKPMEGLLAGIGGVAGTTLLGDGRVLIVLDLAELLR